MIYGIIGIGCVWFLGILCIIALFKGGKGESIWDAFEEDE